MSEVLLEMERAELLNPTGRNLLAVTGQNPQQRWKGFLRVMVDSARSNRAHEKASIVVNGFNRAKMALALSYAMSMPLGLKVATDVQKHLSTTDPPTRTVAEVFQNAVLGEEVLAELATILLRWNRSRQPLPSFQEWLKKVVLERRKEDAEDALRLETKSGENESPLYNIVEELEQRQDDETE